MSALYGTYARSTLAFERGEGVRLFDQDGTRLSRFPRRHRGQRARPWRPASGRGAEGGGRKGLAHLQRLHHSRAGAAGPAAGRRDLCRRGVLHQFGRRGGGVRHQDGAALFLGQGRARALRDHRLHRLVPRPHHGAPSPPAAIRALSRGLRPAAARASSILAPGDLDAVEAADHAADLRHPDRAGAGRGRRHRHDAPSSCAACARSATSTACC